MKTNEFIKLIEALDFVVNKCENEVTVEDVYNNNIIVISEKDVFEIDTRWNKFSELSSSLKNELLEIAVAYTSTPLEEREEEKLYRLKLIAPILTEIGDTFLNKVIDKDEYFLSDEEESPYCTVIFTESELKIMDLTGFERVEVTE